MVSALLSFWCNSVMTFLPMSFKGYFTGTGAIEWLPHCQWSNPKKYASIDHLHLQITDNTTTMKQAQQTCVHISWDIFYDCYSFCTFDVTYATSQ